MRHAAEADAAAERAAEKKQVLQDMVSLLLGGDASLSLNLKTGEIVRVPDGE